LEKQGKNSMYPLSLHFMGLVGKTFQWLFFIVGVLYIMFVVRSLICGVHRDNYSSPTWMIKFCIR
jgi:hypothetical protein